MTGKQDISKTALVTGATGYIGSRLVSRLLDEGWQVSVLLRPSSSVKLLQPCLEKITLFIHDGSLRGMLEIMQSAKPAVVLHLAAVALSEHRPEDVDALLGANVIFSTYLVEAMSHCGVKNIVNTETFWQHYSGAEYSPVCLYAATKQAFRDILVYYADVGGVNAISLVLYDTYGPDDPRMKLFALLRQAAQTTHEIDMTPGEQVIDMTHVDDVVSAYLRAAEMLRVGQRSGFATYALTSGQRMTLRQLVELFVTELGGVLKLNWGGRAYRTREVMTPCYGEQLPGWMASIDLVTGIRQLFK